MLFIIKDKKLRKTLDKIELECSISNPLGYSLFGQIRQLGKEEISLEFGSFTPEESEKLINIIQTRKNKKIDGERKINE
jgi:hypothetical protein